MGVLEFEVKPESDDTPNRNNKHKKNISWIFQNILRFFFVFEKKLYPLMNFDLLLLQIFAFSNFNFLILT